MEWWVGQYVLEGGPGFAGVCRGMREWAKRMLVLMLVSDQAREEPEGPGQAKKGDSGNMGRKRPPVTLSHTAPPPVRADPAWDASNPPSRRL